MERLLQRVLLDDRARNWLVARDARGLVSDTKLMESGLCMTRSEGAPDASSVLIVPSYVDAEMGLSAGCVYSEESVAAPMLSMLRAGGNGELPRPISHRLCCELSNMERFFRWVNFEWLDDGSVFISEHFMDFEGNYTVESMLLAGAKDGAGIPRTVICSMAMTERIDCEDCSNRGISCACAKDVRRAKWRRGCEKPSWNLFFGAMRSTMVGRSVRSMTLCVPSPDGEDVKFEMVMSVEHVCVTDVSHLDKMRAQLVRSLGAIQHNPASGLFLTDSVLAHTLSVEAEDMYQACPELFEGLSPSPLPLELGERDECGESEAVWLAEPVSGEALQSADDLTNISKDWQQTSDSSGDHTNRVSSPISVYVSDATSNALTHGQSDDNSATTQIGISRPRASIAKAKAMPMVTAPVRKTAKQRLACGQCSRTFRHHGHWRDHQLAVHMRLRPHACERCGKNFARNSDLMRHKVKVHAIARMWTCSEKGCNAEFNEKRKLLLHFRTAHTNIKPFQCTIGDCDRSYSRSSSLKKHIEEKHAWTLGGQAAPREPPTVVPVAGADTAHVVPSLIGE